MTREVCESQLSVGKRRRNDDVHFFEQFRHSSHGQSSRPICLDIFHRWIKTGYAKYVWPVVRALLCEQIVSTSQGQVIESRRGLSIQQKSYRVQRQIRHFNSPKIETNLPERRECGEIVLAIVIPARSGFIAVRLPSLPVF